jgi:hypothetical protein
LHFFIFPTQQNMHPSQPIANCYILLNLLLEEQKKKQHLVHVHKKLAFFFGHKPTIIHLWESYGQDLEYYKVWKTSFWVCSTVNNLLWFCNVNRVLNVRPMALYINIRKALFRAFERCLCVLRVPRTSSLMKWRAKNKFPYTVWTGRSLRWV